MAGYHPSLRATLATWLDSALGFPILSKWLAYLITTFPPNDPEKYHMKRQCKVTILLFFTILILQGCTTTRTIGQKLAEFGPITRMGVVFQQSSFGNTAFDPVSIGAFEANQTLIKLAPLLPTRMQLVFATNDIESKVILGHPNVMTINPWTSPSEITQLQDYQYLLTILPTSSTYQSYGGHISIGGFNSEVQLL